MWGIFRVNPQFTYEPPPTCGTCPKGTYCTDEQVQQICLETQD
jgi:hypothetical protein